MKTLKCITPPLLGNAAKMRIVVSWGSKPTDVDSYLDTPGCVVSYRKRECPAARLDVDVTNGFGPETVTVTRFDRGTYKFYLKNFSGDRPLKDTARVVVYTAEGERTYVAARGDGRVSGTGKQEVWDVFTFTVL